MRKRLHDIPHKFDEYSPRTDEEKAIVAEYRQLQKSIHEHVLPDYYSPEQSFRLLKSWQLDEMILSDRIRTQSNLLLRDLEKVLGTYDVLVVQGRKYVGMPEP